MLEGLAIMSPALILIAEKPVTDARDSLEQLMALYQEGNLAAATELIDSISPRLYRFFAAYVVSRTEADDLLQETWLRIHKVRHTYRRGEPAIAWFYAIARHVRVDHYRRAARSSLRERDLDEIAETAGMPPPAERRDELDALLAPLSPGEREVIELLKVEGLSLEEVARATSATVGSVKQKAHRAYKKIREAFGNTMKKSEAPR